VQYCQLPPVVVQLKTVPGAAAKEELVRVAVVGVRVPTFVTQIARHNAMYDVDDECKDIIAFLKSSFSLFIGYFNLQINLCRYA